MAQMTFLDAPAAVAGSAVISPCGRYRYRLERRWGEGPPVMFCMLNPSTADAETPDPTMTRCAGYARRWGFGALLIGNLFALRSTDPRELYRAADPVGPENDEHLAAMAAEAGMIVCAWGNHGAHLGQGDRVRLLLPSPRVLRLTKEGQPWHPLYLSKDLEPVAWEPRGGRAR